VNVNEGLEWDNSNLEDDDAAVRALIPAYALGATDGNESAAVAALVARDPVAAAELAAYRPLRTALLYSAQPVAPPPALEARLRAATQPALAPAPRRVYAPPQVTARETPQSRPRSAGRRRWFAPSTRPAWALAGAAIALLIVTNLWWGIQAQQLRVAQANAQSAQATATIAQATAEAKIAEYDHMIAALATGQAATAMLPAANAPADSAPTTGAHAMIIWMPGESSAMVMAEEFPPLKPGDVYQVWLLYGDDLMSGGMFYVDDKGSAMFMVESPMPLDSLDGVGITMEPAGGSATPTGVQVVRGTI
jgi:hypothetical protein